jgi:hypothetical protein
MPKKIELILLSTEQEYRQEYTDTFVSKDMFSLWGVPVVFDIKSFDHIFFEPDEEGGKKTKFSKRRAKKMYFMKAILSGEVDIEIMYQPDRDNFAVFCPDLDCVIYLRNRIGTGKLQVETFFDFGKDHTKMYKKQKKKCISISQEEFKGRIK